ncbi:hypothetical protein ANN_10039 [Periplaneta americana]|uniref:G-protein coupled receptors family 3 profile domain-containing protein n=1 Tax=Periplaneta americana TaxID=6978 RepID=A0ABQ8TPR7_PERAM|nr:hypothetical protein ANN_10039 [Periplaneta americana]
MSRSEQKWLEVMFLVWGIRLCIVVRKAPSEFNESRFISMAIYNEFLLSVFLNVSMLFLQSPANPDLLYIIFFCHTQLTVTLLLCLIFGSKAYMVFKGHGKSEESSSVIPKPQAAKFLSKPTRSGNSQYAPSTNSSTAGMQEYAKLTEVDVQEEFQRLYTQLEQLKEKNMRLGNRHLAAKISAMQEAAKQNYNVSVVEEDAPSKDHLKLNNVLAVVTDKIVCATVTTEETAARPPAVEKARSPLVSSPDSETPLRHSPTAHRIGAANLSKPLNDSGGPSLESGGRALKDSSVTPTSDRQTRGHKEDLSDSGVRLVDLEMASTCKKNATDGASGTRGKRRGNAGKSRNSSSSGGGSSSGSKKKSRTSSEGDGDKRRLTETKSGDSGGQSKSEGVDNGQHETKPANSQSSSEGASPRTASLYVTPPHVTSFRLSCPYDHHENDEPNEKLCYSPL